MLARHAILLTPSIAASLPLACRGAERTFLVPHACTRPKNPLSSFLATDPKKHLLSPIIATLPKRTEITPVFATHPRPPWEASPFLFALSAAERNTSLAIALPQSPIPYPLSSFFSYSYALFGTTAVSQLFSNQPITHSFHRDGGCTSLCGYSVFKGRDHNIILQTGVWPHTIPGHVL